MIFLRNCLTAACMAFVGFMAAKEGFYATCGFAFSAAILWLLTAGQRKEA